MAAPTATTAPPTIALPTTDTPIQPPQPAAGDKQNENKPEGDNNDEEAAEPKPRPESVILWDLAKLEADRKRLERAAITTERQVIVVGMRGCGKTTLINRLSGKEEKPGQSMGLEYTYWKYQVKESLEDVLGHVYECPPSHLMASLIKPILHERTVRTTSLFACIDLSEAAAMPDALAKLLSVCGEVTMEAVRKLDTAAQDELKKKSRLRLGLNAPPDASMLNPFTLPVWIVGCKYDKFQDYEPDKKLMVTSYLRFFARRIGAGLAFFHWRSDAACARLKVIVNHLLYPSGSQNEIAVAAIPAHLEHQKMLFIKPTDDSMQKIGAPPGGAPANARDPDDLWRGAFGQSIKLREAKEFSAKPHEDIAWNQFEEPKIDQLYLLKTEELNRNRLRFGED